MLPKAKAPDCSGGSWLDVVWYGSSCDKILTVMDCAECKLLADQAAVTAEEVEKISERIVADFRVGSASPALVKSLEAAERTYERCLASVQRHAQSHGAVSPFFAPDLGAAL